MASIEGTGAYATYAAGSYLTVSAAQPGETTLRTAVSPGSKRVVEDKVTLSETAQAFLDQQARGASPQQASSAAIGHGNLVGADLSGDNYAGTDLSNIFLLRANLTGTDLRGANLQNTWLSYSNVTGADFRGADLRGANLSNVTGLTKSQLAAATVDLSTVLPFNVVYEAS